MAEVNWYPGHMTKAMRDIKAKLKLVDLVIELADARIPASSRNPELNKLLLNKPRLLVLSKKDLADPTWTERWLNKYQTESLAAAAFNLATIKGMNDLAQKCRELVADKLRRAEDKGRSGRPVRAMVLGIPNTGKSTLINSLAGRKAVVTGDRPGVTRALQWVRTGDLELMDVPGVLWPKITSAHAQLVLAATGAVKDQVFDVEDIAARMIECLAELYPLPLMERLKLTDLDQPVWQLYEEGARNRGCLQSGGKLNTLRFATLFLDELRSGKMGKITLDRF
ncbi:ribosome biogenesis GTPase YlqF [Mageeibacillus indolicus]|jgi:hypothetical protein|uniref:Ribosome biogenesis GTPase A n=2 Tax=Mageeibacillus indolicus TaxID=884684 RepID=D3R2P5_MAGIU|nr:ribosome biogenesis GTPase YlqF [Mageeibacillus indolicus]ADC91613.1 ribosome biogenesis GTP-binding protein YlqF [Mageeibacillus indolicus UPII9-5]KFA57343.1 hypothetical protein HMPREF1632_04115 [Mageeibacillus indolicus 0009-5]PNH19930.1 ribosome biogenesis GTPase YlqF [Mageeibacillus indolicus]